MKKTTSILSSPYFVELVKTEDIVWILPARLILGILFLIPLAGSINEIWGVQSLSAIGSLLRFIEIICGLSLALGAIIRISAYPALLLILMHILSNMANSFDWVGGLVGPFLAAHGDWAYGGTYLGAGVLLLDLLSEGSGRFSVDRAIYKSLKHEL